jgi:gliding motility-associated-like protein
VYLNANPTNRSILLKWNPETPWINKEAKIFRQIGLNTFNLVGLTQTQSFLDTGLVNGQSYCYQIETKGNYDTNYYPAPIYNFSQLVCAIPIDTIKPCAPILSIDTPCQNFTILEIKLHWKYPASCDQDVVKYRIYWKKNLKEKWELIDSVPLGTNEYIDSREKLKFSIAGCYAVSAVDSFENESFLDNEKCVDNCPYYSIPNVFSPGLDGLNDVLKPFPYRFIDDIHLQIYNRWGQLVFETRNLDFTWDGTDQKNGKALSEGVYYYLLDINESYLAGSKKRSNRGTLTIIR